MIDATRSPAPPASLAAGTQYDGQDVRRRLYDDFSGKCYLCEGVLASRAAMEVDHRRPKADPSFQHLKFEWTNLFPACPDCNNRRPDWPATGGLLSPGDPATPDLEQRIIQRLEPGRTPWARFYARDPADTDAENTARELRHLHTAERGSTNSKWKSIDLRDAVILLALELHRSQSAIYRLERDGKKNTPEWSDARDKVRAALSRRSPYTMLLRSVVDAEFHGLFD